MTHVWPKGEIPRGAGWNAGPLTSDPIHGCSNLPLHLPPHPVIAQDVVHIQSWDRDHLGGYRFSEADQAFIWHAVATPGERDLGRSQPNFRLLLDCCLRASFNPPIPTRYHATAASAVVPAALLSTAQSVLVYVGSGTALERRTATGRTRIQRGQG